MDSTPAFGIFRYTKKVCSVKLLFYISDKYAYIVHYIEHKMKSATLLPKEKRILTQLGENIRLARLRRKISAELLAERANIGRTTLWNLEKGNANVSLTSLIRVLSALGMAGELGRLAQDDALGRKLQDIELMKTKGKGS